MSLPVVIVGLGGHGRALADALAASGRTIRGVFDREPGVVEGTGLDWLGPDEAAEALDPTTVELVHGIGHVGDAQHRRQVAEAFGLSGFGFTAVVHPSATVSPGAVLYEGAQVMAGAVVQTGARIGAFAIINSGAVVDHDCCVGAYAHVAPGAALSGGVAVGEGALIGTGAAVIQGISIGAGARVGAGAAVVTDVQAGATVVGVPARPVANR